MLLKCPERYDCTVRKDIKSGEHDNNLKYLFFFFQYIYPFTHIKCGTKAPILFMQVKSFIYADENASY